MADSFDVVIIGGGAIGSAIACFLMLEPGFGGTVAVVERDPTYRTASSALSASSIRQQFSTPFNVAVSRFGLEVLKHPERWLEVEGEVPDFGFHEKGYLFLATPAGQAVLQQNHEMQVGEGVAVDLMAPDRLAERFPWLNVDGLAAGSLGLAGEGWFDGYSLLQAFKRKARSLGATYITDTVTGIDRAGGRVIGVTLADGSRIGCGTLVNAAGPQAGKVAALAGIDLPVEGRKRCVFVFDCRQTLGGCPLVIDPSGVWFRPEGNLFICGAPPTGEDPDTEDLTVDHGLFDEMMWPALAERVPAFESLKVVNSWAGHYEMNTVDHNAIIGPHPELPNLIFANGFSGHGLQQSPAAGRGVAELIAHGGFRSLDLSPFAFTRILENRPIVELNVV
jgi:glycine/D-amino acid oxidase-like deaminating enzyme